MNGILILVVATLLVGVCKFNVLLLLVPPPSLRPTHTTCTQFESMLKRLDVVSVLILSSFLCLLYLWATKAGSKTR